MNVNNFLNIVLKLAFVIIFFIINITTLRAQVSSKSIKIIHVDTTINIFNIKYIYFFNKKTLKTGIILGKSFIESGIYINNNTFALSPGNSSSKRVYIYTTYNEKNCIFNCITNNKKEGIWINYLQTGFVDNVEYYENNKLYLRLKFRKNGSLETVYRFKNGQLDDMNIWHYNKKGIILNHSADF